MLRTITTEHTSIEKFSLIQALEDLRENSYKYYGEISKKQCR